MIFRQLFDSKSSTYTYLLGCEDTLEAVLIDPVFEQVNRDLALVHELGLTLKYGIDTHCHADHVTGAWLLKHKTNSQIACAEVINSDNIQLALKHGSIIQFGNLELEVRATPGHTDGCLTYVCHSEKLAFTGDTLLIRGCGRCDFQQGDAAQMYDSIHKQIFSLPDDFMLYPGHDYSGRCMTTVKEEKAFNARLGGAANKEDFVGYMNNMTLPHPKFIDIALPANLKCGEPDSLPEEPNWAPLDLTYAGVYEVDPIWVASHASKVNVVDVREAIEVAEGHIANAISIPLGDLANRASELPNDKPLVTFCRSGRRSALAVNILNKAGFSNVANVTGGVLNWQELGLPLQK
jgi:glyoxylase-like metal-dependent hydrolase (beta-lactamase superfamily II)/rhodanese-related sulfurtransferase